MKHKTKLIKKYHYQSVCDTKTCPEYGNKAVQGRCFHKLDKSTEAHLVRAEAFADQYWEDTEACMSGMSDKAKIKYLRSLTITQWLNHELVLDELIRLRLKLHVQKKSTSS